MDLRQLEMFRAVAENLSFTLGAQELNVAQSAVSRKIRLLERELGQDLFKRINKRIFLTPAGETLVRYASRVFQELRNAVLEIEDLGQMKRGTIKIGSGMTACMYVLPPVIEEFQNRFPLVNIQVVTASTETLVPQIRDGQIDLGVLTLPIGFSDLDVT